MIDVALFIRLRGLYILANDFSDFFNTLPRMQGRPFGGLLTLVKMLKCLERTLGAGLLLPRLFLPRARLPPLPFSFQTPRAW